MKHYEDYELSKAEEDEQFGPDEAEQQALEEQEWLEEYDPDEEEKNDRERIG